MRPRATTASETLARIRQVVLVAMGWTIVVAGLIIVPLPGPFGVPIMILGALILLPNSPRARRLLIRMKRGAPGMLSPLVHRFEDWRSRRRHRRRT